MASNARQGYFDDFRVLDDRTEAMHRLSITYSKVRKDLQRHKARLRAHLELVFPEFVKTINLDSDSARYLLSNYVLPPEYLALEVETVAVELSRVSRNQHGRETLLALQKAAENSIGLKREALQARTDHLIVLGWLVQIKTTGEQLDLIAQSCIELAGHSPHFERIKSIKGISDLSAALFLAETYNLTGFTHYKQIEKLAGTNLRQSQSGKTVGRRKLSKLGNARLRWLLYRMTEEAIKYVPEVRIKYLNRQLIKGCYRKNLLAATPKLLELIIALCRDGRCYYTRLDTLNTLAELEKQYDQKLSKHRNKTAA